MSCAYYRGASERSILARYSLGEGTRELCASRAGGMRAPSSICLYTCTCDAAREHVVVCRICGAPPRRVAVCTRCIYYRYVWVCVYVARCALSPEVFAILRVRLLGFFALSFLLFLFSIGIAVDGVYGRECMEYGCIMGC